MVQITIDADVGALTEKLNPSQIDRVKRQGLLYAGQELIRTLMINSPVDHGLLKMWHFSSIGEDEVHIRSPASYAVYVNEGTSLHWVEPTSKKALHWDGKYFSKGHYVGGIKGQHFVENSIDDVSGRLDGYFLKALQEVLG